MRLVKQLDKDEFFRERDFLKDLDFSRLDLDQAITTHSGFYYHYGKLHRIAAHFLEDAKIKVDMKSKNLKLVYAEVSIRKRQAKEKLTESHIESLTLEDKKYKTAEKQLFKAKQELVDLQFDVSMLELAEKVFKGRGDLLRSMAYAHQAEGRADFEVHDKEGYQERTERFIEGQKKQLLARRQRHNKRRKS